MSDMDASKIWANSGDSHYMEPPNLYDQLPEHLKDRMPKTVRDEVRGVEVITVDGQSFERSIPKPRTPEQLMRTAARPLEEDLDEGEGEGRAPGAFDPELRLVDLDNEGIWAEAIYPSLGTWTFNIRTPEIVKEGCRISNEFFIDFQRKSPRYVVAASIPLLDVGDTVAEIGVPVTWASSSASSRSGHRRAAALAERGVGPGVGGPRAERAWCSASISVPSRSIPPAGSGSTTMAEAAPSSTTWRPPTAASGP